MNILLVDDEELQLIRLEKAVKTVLDGANIFSFTNPKKALEESKKHNIDIAFLDIEMPVINGIELAKQLKRVNPTINLIFVTAYDAYALNTYQLHASGYLLKPVKAEKIKEEIEALRYPVSIRGGKKIQIKCFGNFEIFYNGEPVRFSYKKSKEAFAYLVDREGSAINVNELNAILWEEDHPSYLRNLIADIQQTFKNLGCEDVFVKRYNECFINVDNVDCDAYEYKKGNPNAIRMFRGEYMNQYSWPIFEDNY